MSPQKSDSALPRKHCTSCSCRSSDDDVLVNTIEAADIAILRLQDDIEKKIRSLAQLRQKRNQLLPIGRLSPELLCEIFLYYRDAQTPPTIEYIERVPWIPAIHTCVYWRAVVLADVRFWSTPDLRFPLFVHGFAHHFGAASLRVMLSGSRYGDTPMGPQLEQHGISAVLSTGNPIVALDLHAHYEELRRCIKELLSHAANDVRTIHLGVGPDELEEYPETVSLHHLGYFNAGVDCLPNLRVLSLHTIAFDWESMLKNCMGTLRELTLAKCDFRMSEMGPLAQIPHLEKLVFFENYQYDDFRSNDPTVIVFPALAELHLCRELTDVCSSLLEHFHLPAGCCTTITPFVEQNRDPAAIVRYMAAPDPSVVRVIFDDNVFELQCELATRVKHSMRLPQKDICTMDALRTFAWALESKPPVLEVSVVRGQSITTAELSLLLTEAESVRTLTAQGHCLEALTECLCTRESCLPYLERLEVRDADFTQLEPVALQHWTDALRSRSAVLKTVITEGCEGVPPAPGTQGQRDRAKERAI